MSAPDGVLASPATDALLKQAWRALDGPPAALEDLSVDGLVPGLLPSTVPALPAMVAAVAASTLAVSVLDHARGASRRPVTVSAGHVAAAARSERYAHLAGQPAPPPFAELSRFWPTSDGSVRMHANYPWHRDRALQVLGCRAHVDSVAAALAGLTTAEVEESFAAAGALAFGVRTLDQWQRHPHGAAVHRLPLVERTDPVLAGRPVGPGSALAGVKVLDLTRVIAGPVATRTLAAWGADVLRVDSPRLPEIEAQCIDTLVGKRSALLDAADHRDRAVLEALLAEADVVVQGYRPGAFERLGLDAPQLSRRHPHLTVVTLSAWGSGGPWSQRRGFDSLVQAPTGLADLERGADGHPGTLPAQVLDHATGYLAAAAAALSLASVQAGGPSWHRRLSLAQTSAWLCSVAADEPASQPQAPVDVAPWLLDLPGKGGGCRVLAPPGRLGAVRPSWGWSTRFGADLPAFGRPASRPSQ